VFFQANLQLINQEERMTDKLKQVHAGLEMDSSVSPLLMQANAGLQPVIECALLEILLVVLRRPQR
jgi:hypothetical protein